MASNKKYDAVIGEAATVAIIIAIVVTIRLSQSSGRPSLTTASGKEAARHC
jgi:hypothetical protein